VEKAARYADDVYLVETRRIAGHDSPAALKDSGLRERVFLGGHGSA